MDFDPNPFRGLWRTVPPVVRWCILAALGLLALAVLRVELFFTGH